MFDIFLKEVETLFVGRHKTGPCESSVTNGTWTLCIFLAALFYALWAILCFSNFRHGQAWHHRCGSKDMGQTASLLAWLPHGFRPTALLGAEACLWFSFYFFVLNIKQSWPYPDLWHNELMENIHCALNSSGINNLCFCRSSAGPLVMFDRF